MDNDRFLSALSEEERRKGIALKGRLQEECNRLEVGVWVDSLATRLSYPLPRILIPPVDYLILESRVRGAYQQYVLPTFRVGMLIEALVDRDGTFHLYLFYDYRSLPEHKVEEVPIERKDDWDFIIEIVERFRLIPV